MRNRQLIEREINSARIDLEESLAALKHSVQEKVDVKARARVALERGKATALDLYVKGRMVVDERPVLVGTIAAGVIALGTLAYMGRRRDWW